MLILKYKKTGDAKYIPHVDTLRVLTRTLRRMGIEVEFSQGFNPHMLLNMSPPLPVGIESLSEFVEIQTNAEAKGFAALFDKYCPTGFGAEDVWQVEKSPRITANTKAAEYEAILEGGERLIFTLPCGNTNVRADKYILEMGKNPQNAKITRTKLFAGEGGTTEMGEFILQSAVR